MKRRPPWIYAIALVAVAAALLVAWNWGAMRAKAAVGVAFGARVACSCRYVEGRSMDSCKGDKEPGMALVRMTDDPESREVRASVPLLASRTARYRPGWGCLLDPAQ